MSHGVSDGIQRRALPWADRAWSEARWREVSTATQTAIDLRNSQPIEARGAAESAYLAMHQVDPARWDGLAVRCLYTLGDLRFRTGDGTDAVAILLEALELASVWDGAIPVDPLLVHHVHARLSSVYNNLGLYAFALSESYAAREIAEEHDDASALAWSWGDIAMIHLSMGDAEGAARAAADAVLAGSRPDADPARLGIAHIYALAADSRLGDYPGGERHAAAAHALADHLQAAERAGLLIASGELAMRRGEVAEAEGSFGAALDELDVTGERFAVFGALSGQAGARLVRGDFGGARDLLQRALALGDPTASLTVLCERMMAQALEGLGDLQGALEWLKRSHLDDRRLLQANNDEQVRVLELEHRAKLAERQAEAERGRAERAELEQRRSAERYEALLEESAGLVGVIDDDLRVVRASTSCLAILGTPADDIRGVHAISMVHEADQARVEHAFAEARRHPGIPASPIDYRVQHRTGTWLHLSAVVTDLRHEPGVAGFMMVAKDITVLRWNEALVESQAAVLDLITWSAPLSQVLDLLVATVDDLCGPSVTARIEWAIPAGPGATPGLPVLDGSQRQPLTDRAGRVVAVLATALAGGRRPTAAEEQVLEQTVRLAQIAVERSTAAASIAHQATHDHLTGLPNRLHFEAITTAAVSHRISSSSSVAVLFLDLDRFKLVNDSFGHATGDRLLVEVTRRIQACLGPGEVAARFGGDEFTVLCPSVVDGPQATVLADRLIDAIRAPFLLDEAEVCLSVSIGISLAHSPTGDADMLITEADSAMFRAKEQGRDRSALFDHGMRIASESRLLWGTALRRALPREELRLDYQPVIDLRTQQLVGHEALLRWHSSELGFVRPGEFIGLAEETGLIVPIGAWVIRTALAQLAGQADPLPMWVNLSTRQVEHPSLVQTVSDALAATEVDPSLLCFEITESALGTDLDTAIDRISALHDLGARIAIDDFGTGYSSLDRLQSLPVQVLKVDRSFVDGVDASPRRLALLRAVLELSSSLGMETVAEGVETPAELAALRDAGCPMVQGFLLARPAAAPLHGQAFDIEALIRS